MWEKSDESQKLTSSWQEDDHDPETEKVGTGSTAPTSTSETEEIEQMQGNGKKRTSEEAGPYVFPEDLAKMSRAERKRHREKKRRSDVNRGFDDLMGLLIEIDPEVRAEAEEKARRGLWKGSLGAAEDNLLSRVDLICRSVEVLRRVHLENEQRKLIIAQLTGKVPGKSREVTMMLPVLQPAASSLPSYTSQPFLAPGLGSTSFSDPRAAAGLLAQPSYLPPVSASPALPPGEFLGFNGTALQFAAGGLPSDAQITAAATAAARLRSGGFSSKPRPGLGS